MTIRLTSPEVFNEVLKKLRKHPDFDEEINSRFLNHWVPIIIEGLMRGGDEYFVKVKSKRNRAGFKVFKLYFSRRSEIQTDEEYLKTI